MKVLWNNIFFIITSILLPDDRGLLKPKMASADNVLGEPFQTQPILSVYTLRMFNVQSSSAEMPGLRITKILDETSY